MRTDHETISRLASEEQSRQRHQGRNLAILAVAIVAGLGGIVYALKEMARSQPEKVQIEVSKLPPVRPGPSS